MLVPKTLEYHCALGKSHFTLCLEPKISILEPVLKTPFLGCVAWASLLSLVFLLQTDLAAWLVLFPTHPLKGQRKERAVIVGPKSQPGAGTQRGVIT